MPRGDKTTVASIRMTDSELDKVKDLTSLYGVETSEAVRLAVRLAHAIETQLSKTDQVVVTRSTEIDVDAQTVRMVGSRLLVLR